MKSGLEDRNNQYIAGTSGQWGDNVSMKSGLEDRNNEKFPPSWPDTEGCLNEVRPGRPEQLLRASLSPSRPDGLNEVRPGRPEQ